MAKPADCQTITRTVLSRHQKDKVPSVKTIGGALLFSILPNDFQFSLKSPLSLKRGGADPSGIAQSAGMW